MFRNKNVIILVNISKKIRSKFSEFKYHRQIQKVWVLTFDEHLHASPSGIFS